MYNKVVNIPIPQWYNLEITSHCNLKCPYCLTGRGAIPLSARGNMSRENFEIIFTKIRPHAKMVQLFNWGEPFMHKDLCYFIEKFTAAGIGTQISTNLTVRLFDEAELERIVNSGLESMLASIDGVTQQAYEAYRRNGDVEKALTNLRNLQRTKERLKSPTPHLIWGFYMNRFNEHQVDEARDLASEMNVDIWFKELSCPEDFQSRLIRTQPKLLASPKNLPLLWRGRQTGDLPLFELDPRLPKTCNVCKMPFEIVVIGVTGDVFPCTTVMEKKFVVGNLLTESLEDIWHNTMKENREQLMSVSVKRPHSQCFKCHHFPSTLSDVPVMPHTKATSEEPA